MTSAPSQSAPATTDGTTASATPSATQTPSAAASSPASAASGVAPCTTGQLRLSISGQQGAAGTDYQTLVFTNAGTASCQLAGFPGVSLRDAGGQVGAAAGRNGPAGAPVVLAAGAAAHTVLSIANAGNYASSACQPKPATQVRVYPPGQTTFLTATDAVRACSKAATQQLRVTAISEGGSA